MRSQSATLGAKILFVIAIIAIIFSWWGEDRRSCERQIAPRTQGIVREQVLHDFLYQAAKARFYSVRHESAALAKNDLKVGYLYLSDMNRLRTIKIPVCDKFLPDT